MGIEAAVLVGGEFGTASHGQRVQHTGARYGDLICIKLTTLEKHTGQRAALHPPRPSWVNRVSFTMSSTSPAASNSGQIAASQRTVEAGREETFRPICLIVAAATGDSAA